MIDAYPTEAFELKTKNIERFQFFFYIIGLMLICVVTFWIVGSEVEDELNRTVLLILGPGTIILLSVYLINIKFFFREKPELRP